MRMREGYLVRIGSKRYWTDKSNFVQNPGTGAWAGTWIGDGTLQKVSPVRQGAGAAFPKYSIELFLHQSTDITYYSKDIGPADVTILSLTHTGTSWELQETFHGVVSSWAVRDKMLNLTAVHQLEWQTIAPVIELWSDIEQRNRYPADSSASPALATDRAFARAALTAELARNHQSEWPN